MLASSLAVFTNAYTVGDFNGDGRINAIDACIMGGYVLAAREVKTLERADLDGNRKVNSIDLSLMAKYFVGKYEIGDSVKGDFFAETANAEKYKTYLADRLKASDDDVILGIGSSEKYGVDMSDYENDGYRYFCEDGRLVIEGARERGCMYGVWRFPDKECGWTEQASAFTRTTIPPSRAGLQTTTIRSTSRLALIETII